MKDSRNNPSLAGHATGLAALVALAGALFLMRDCPPRSEFTAERFAFDGRDTADTPQPVGAVHTPHSRTLRDIRWAEPRLTVSRPPDRRVRETGAPLPASDFATMAGVPPSATGTNSAAPALSAFQPRIPESCSTVDAIEQIQPAPVSAAAHDGVELAEARVRGRVRGTIELRREGDELLLPLEDVADLLELDLTRTDRSIALTTPLGVVELPDTALAERDGRTMIGSSELRKRLHTGVHFDTRSVSIDFDPLWRYGNRREQGLPERPDIAAPRLSLAGIRTEATHTRFGDARTTAGTMRLAGRMADGVWSVVAEESSIGPGNLQEALWYGRRNRMHYVAGRQRVQLMSSLGDFDLVGLQFGWSNDEVTTIPSVRGSGAVLPRRGRPTQSTRGTAPAGSFVQLRVDGSVIATQQVGFDGEYTFERTPLPSGHAAEIELLIFNPNDLKIPIEVRRQRLASSDLLLERGVVQHLAGVGLTGRFREGLTGTGSGPDAEGGGYYLWRQGLTENLTGEASLQSVADGEQGFAGVIARLGGTWIAEAGALYDRGETGHDIGLDGDRKPWRFLARSRRTRARAAGGIQGFHDHRLELSRSGRSGWLVGLTARDRKDGQGSTRFVRPTLTWYPRAGMFLDARPDIYGDYLVNASWRPSDRTLLRYFRSQTSTFELTRRQEKTQYGWSSHFEGVAPRNTIWAGLHRNTRSGALYVRGGAVRTGGKWGYSIGAGAPVAPGVLARAEYQSIPEVQSNGTTPGRFLLNLVSDFGVSGRRLVPARTQGFRNELGGISGALVIDGAPDSRFDLAGARVFVDGKRHGVTDSRGRFFVGSIEPGIHRVELHPDRLPIELNPTRIRVTAEVVPGAATRVDFPMQMEFGVAGRLHGQPGQPVANIRVRLIDAGGASIDAVSTDRFGLFRFDSVAPGRYVLEVVDRKRVIAGREITVQSDHLFDQDLTLEPPGRPDLQVQRTNP